MALGSKGVSRIVVESTQRRKDRNDMSRNLKLGITLINYSKYICIYCYLFYGDISNGQLRGYTDIFEKAHMIFFHMDLCCNIKNNQY